MYPWSEAWESERAQVPSGRCTIVQHRGISLYNLPQSQLDSLLLRTQVLTRIVFTLSLQDKIIRLVGNQRSTFNSVQSFHEPYDKRVKMSSSIVYPTSPVITKPNPFLHAYHVKTLRHLSTNAFNACTNVATWSSVMRIFSAINPLWAKYTPRCNIQW